MAAAAQRAFDTFGTVHILCNNAGVGGGGGPMWQLTDADWTWAIDVNLRGVTHALRLLLPRADRVAARKATSSTPPRSRA